VATIGSFDGVHLGHQAILARLLEVGRAAGLPTLVMVFEPQPHEYFSREKAPPRLMRLREKVKALFELGVDRVLCLRFDAHLRNLSALDFIERILVDHLAVAHLEIGDDFRFGCDRTGDFRMLQQLGPQFGFQVRDTKTFLLQGERVSSTRVRQLLETAQFSAAAHLLGRPYCIGGRVIVGKRLGRTLGVPTANIGLGPYRSPISGVFAARVKLHNDNKEYWGAANLGVRPTVTGGAKPLLEVHLLDYSGDLYGRCLQVEFCHKLREERKFGSLDELKYQIQRDITATRQFFLSFNRSEHS
jgi:riboflavin kinase/FMN adenylyltransferase